MPFSHGGSLVNTILYDRIGSNRFKGVFIRNTGRDTVMTEKILTSLSLKMNPRDLKYTDPKGPLQALFYQWLPIGRNLLDMIVDTLPSPFEMSNDKVEHLICSKLKSFSSLPKQTQDLKGGNIMSPFI